MAPSSSPASRRRGRQTTTTFQEPPSSTTATTTAAAAAAATCTTPTFRSSRCSITGRRSTVKKKATTKPRRNDKDDGNHIDLFQSDSDDNNGNDSDSQTTVELSQEDREQEAKLELIAKNRRESSERTLIIDGFSDDSSDEDVETSNPLDFYHDVLSPSQSSKAKANPSSSNSNNSSQNKASSSNEHLNAASDPSNHRGSTATIAEGSRKKAPPVASLPLAQQRDTDSPLGTPARPWDRGRSTPGVAAGTKTTGLSPPSPLVVVVVPARAHAAASTSSDNTTSTNTNTDNTSHLSNNSLRSNHPSRSRSRSESPTQSRRRRGSSSTTTATNPRRSLPSDTRRESAGTQDNAIELSDDEAPIVRYTIQRQRQAGIEQDVFEIVDSDDEEARTGILAPPPAPPRVSAAAAAAASRRLAEINQDIFEIDDSDDDDANAPLLHVAQSPPQHNQRQHFTAAATATATDAQDNDLSAGESQILPQEGNHQSVAAATLASIDEAVPTVTQETDDSTKGENIASQYTSTSMDEDDKATSPHAHASSTNSSNTEPRPPLQQIIKKAPTRAGITKSNPSIKKASTRAGREKKYSSKANDFGNIVQVNHGKGISTAIIIVDLEKNSQEIMDHGASLVLVQWVDKRTREYVSNTDIRRDLEVGMGLSSTPTTTRRGASRRQCAAPNFYGRGLKQEDNVEQTGADEEDLEEGIGNNDDRDASFEAIASPTESESTPSPKKRGRRQATKRKATKSRPSARRFKADPSESEERTLTAQVKADPNACVSPILQPVGRRFKADPDEAFIAELQKEDPADMAVDYPPSPPRKQYPPIRHYPIKASLTGRKPRVYKTTKPKPPNLPPAPTNEGDIIYFVDPEKPAVATIEELHQRRSAKVVGELYSHERLLELVCTKTGDRSYLPESAILRPLLHNS